MNNFRIDRPFEVKPPRLKDMVNNYVMGDVWVRNTPFGPVTDSLIIAEKFKLKHSNVLRAIQKCREELMLNSTYQLENHFIQSFYYGGAKGR